MRIDNTNVKILYLLIILPLLISCSVYDRFYDVYNRFYDTNRPIKTHFFKNTTYYAEGLELRILNERTKFNVDDKFNIIYSDIEVKNKGDIDIQYYLGATFVYNKSNELVSRLTYEGNAKKAFPDPIIKTSQKHILPISTYLLLNETPAENELTIDEIMIKKPNESYMNYKSYNLTKK